MKRDPQKIAEQIIVLVSELAELKNVSPLPRQPHPKSPLATTNKGKSGATGGIRVLVDEDKLNSPKKLSEIMEFLRRDGRHYSRPTVAMGLLNLVRERILTRFHDKGNKNWKYAKRK